MHFHRLCSLDLNLDMRRDVKRRLIPKNIFSSCMVMYLRSLMLEAMLLKLLTQAYHINRALPPPPPHRVDRITSKTDSMFISHVTETGEKRCAMLNSDGRSRGRRGRSRRRKSGSNVFSHEICLMIDHHGGGERHTRASSQ